MVDSFLLIFFSVFIYLRTLLADHLKLALNLFKTNVCVDKGGGDGGRQLFLALKGKAEKNVFIFVLFK